MNKDTEKLNGTPTQSKLKILYCENHWMQLQSALFERGLDDLIASDPDEAANKFEAGELDALNEASATITTSALSLFGQALFAPENKGCPVCTFQNIIPYIADNIARRCKPQ